MGDVSGFVSRTGAASEDSDDATIPCEENGPRVSDIQELAVRLVVRQDGDLNGACTQCRSDHKNGT